MQDAIQTADRYNRLVRFGGANSESDNISSLQRETAARTLLDRAVQRGFITPQQDYAFRQQEMQQRVLYNRSLWQGYASHPQYLQGLDQERKAALGLADAQKAQNVALQQGTDIGAAHVDQLAGVHKQAQGFADQASNVQAYTDALNAIPDDVKTKAEFDDSTAEGGVGVYNRLLDTLRRTVTSRAEFDDSGANAEATSYNRTISGLERSVTSRAQFDDAEASNSASAYDGLIKSLQQTVVAKAVLDDDTLDSDIAEDKAKINDLGQQKATAKADLDSGDFSSKVEELKVKIKDLGNQTADPNVKLDSRDFLIQLAEIKAQIDALSRESGTVKLNVESSDFGKLKSAFADLENYGARAFDDISARSSTSGQNVSSKWHAVGASLSDVFRAIHSSSDNAASDVSNSFDRVVARIRGAFNGLDRGGVGSVFTNIASAAAESASSVVSALGPMGAAIISVIQLLPALTAGLGSMSGVLAAAPGLIFAAGAALGTLYNVLSPLVQAVGAYNKVLEAQQQAQANPIQTAQQLAQQQHAVSDAYYQVAQAAYQAQQSQLQNAHAVADSQFSLRQAVVQAANQQKTAAHGVADAQYQVQQANYQAKQSAIQNAHAVSDAAYQVQQANYQSRQSAVQNAHAVSDAQYAVSQAAYQAKQSAVQNAHAVNDAQFSVKQAAYQSAQSQIQNAHAVAEAQYGVKDASYQAAQSRINDAHTVSEAQFSLRQAVFQSNQSQIQSSHQVSDAEFSLKQAKYSSAQSQINDSHSVAEAQYALSQATFQANQSQIQSAHAVADAQFGLREAQYASAQQQISDSHNVAEAQFALRQAVVQSGQAQIQSAHAVQEAQFSLRETDFQTTQQRIQDAHSVAEAEFSLKQTQFQSGIQQQQTLITLTDAQHSYEDSVFAVQQAQYQLNITWQDASRAMQDLEEKVAFASLDLRGAQLNLIQAQETYRQTMAQSTSTALARAQAAYQVQVAEKALKDVEIQNTRNEQDLANARKYGKDQTFGVTAAQHALTQAQRASIDAQKSLVITQKEAANQQVQAAHSIKDAVFSLKEALVGRSHDIVTAIHSQADALFALSQAFFAQKESAVTSAHGISDAQFNLVQVMKAKSHDLITAAHAVQEAQYAVGQAFIAQKENAITSAHGISDAQFGLSQSLRQQSHDQISNAHAVSDAQFALSQAFVSQRENAVTSAHTIKDAQFSLAQAIRAQSHDRISSAHAERDAQFVLTQAYAAQKEGFITGAHAQGDAAFALSQAQAAQAEGFITSRHSQVDASFALQQAVASQAEGFITSAHSQGDATFALRQAQAAQAEGFITSQHAQGDAVFALGQAIFQQSQGRITAAHAIFDAQFALSQAEAAQSEGFITGMHNQKDAAFALQAALAAQKLGIPAVASAQMGLNAALADLGPIGQKVFRLLEPLIKWWVGWKGASEAFFKQALPGFKGLITLIQPLEHLMTAVATALGKVADHFLLWLERVAHSPAWNVLTEGTVQIILHLGDAAIKLADAFVRIAVAAEPFTTWLVKGVDRMATEFDNWTKSSERAGSSLHKWINAAKPALHDLGALLKGVVDFFLILAGGRPEFNKAGDLTRVVPTSRDNQNLQTFSIIMRDLASKILPAVALVLQHLSSPQIARAFINVIVSLADLLKNLTKSQVFVQGLQGFSEVLNGLVKALAWLTHFPIVGQILQGIAVSLGAMAILKFSGILLLLEKLGQARGWLGGLLGKLGINFGKAGDVGAVMVEAGSKAATTMGQAIIAAGEKAAASMGEAVSAGGKVAGTEEAAGEATGGKVAAGEIGVGEAAGLGGAAGGAAKGGLFSRILGAGVVRTIGLALTAAAAAGAGLGAVLNHALGKLQAFRKDLTEISHRNPWAHWIPGLEQALAAGKLAGDKVAGSVGQKFAQIGKAFGKGFEHPLFQVKEHGKQVSYDTGQYQIFVWRQVTRKAIEAQAEIPRSIRPKWAVALDEILHKFHGQLTPAMLRDVHKLPRSYRVQMLEAISAVGGHQKSEWADVIGKNVRVTHAQWEKLPLFWKGHVAEPVNKENDRGVTAWKNHMVKSTGEVYRAYEHTSTVAFKSAYKNYVHEFHDPVKHHILHDLPAWWDQSSHRWFEAVGKNFLKPVDDFFGKLLGNVRGAGVGGPASGPTVFPGARHATGGHVAGSGPGDNQIIAATAGEFVVRKPAVEALERTYGPDFLPGFINVADQRLSGAPSPVLYSTPGVGVKLQSQPKDIANALKITGGFAAGGKIPTMSIPGFAGGGAIAGGGSIFQAFDQSFRDIDRDFNRQVEIPISTWITSRLPRVFSESSVKWWDGTESRFRKDVEKPIANWIQGGINNLWNNSIGGWFNSVWPTFTRQFKGQLGGFINNTVNNWWNASIGGWFNSAWPTFVRQFKGALGNFINQTINNWWNSSIGGWFNSVWPSFVKDFKGPLSNFINNTVNSWWNNSIGGWFNSVWSSFVKNFKSPLQNFISNTVNNWWNNSISAWFNSVWSAWVRNVKNALDNFINNTVNKWWNSSINGWFNSVWSAWNNGFGSKLNNFITNTVNSWWNKSINGWFNTVWNAWTDGFGTKLHNFIDQTVNGYWNASIHSWFNSVDSFWQHQVADPLNHYISQTINAQWNGSIPHWFNNVGTWFNRDVSKPLESFFKTSLPSTIEGSFKKSIDFVIGKINEVIKAVDKVTGGVGVKITPIPELHAEGMEVGAFRRTGPGSVAGTGDQDSQPIMATPGEYVVRKAARMALDRTFGPDFLNSAINQADRVLGYAGGGTVSPALRGGIGFASGGHVRGPGAGHGSGATTGSYVNPLKNIHGLIPERIDMGVDFGGTGNLLALGDSHVNGPFLTGWGGAAPGEFMTFTLENGPFANRMYYYSEGINPLVRPGQHVPAGHKVASMHAPIEIGWAGNTHQPLSQLPIAGSISGANLPGGGANPTRVGLNFDQLLVSLGAPKAPNFNAPPGGKLPKNWPTASGGAGGGTVTFGKKAVNAIARLGGLQLSGIDKLLKKDHGFSIDDLWKHVVEADEKSWGIVQGLGIAPQLGVAMFDSLHKAFAAKISQSGGGGGNIPVGIKTGNMLADGRTIFGYLMANIFNNNRIASAGALASMWGESLWNPESAGSGGWGLMGWTGNFPDKRTGNAQKDMAMELPLIKKFISFAGDWGVISQMKNAKTVLEAANEWGHGVERFGINDVHAEGLALAKKIAGLAQGGPVTSAILGASSDVAIRRAMLLGSDLESGWNSTATADKGARAGAFLLPLGGKDKITKAQAENTGWAARHLLPMFKKGVSLAGAKTYPQDAELAAAYALEGGDSFYRTKGSAKVAAAWKQVLAVLGTKTGKAPAPPAGTPSPVTVAKDWNSAVKALRTDVTQEEIDAFALREALRKHGHKHLASDLYSVQNDQDIIYRRMTTGGNLDLKKTSISSLNALEIVAQNNLEQISKKHGHVIAHVAPTQAKKVIADLGKVIAETKAAKTAFTAELALGKDGGQPKSDYEIQLGFLKDAEAYETKQYMGILNHGPQKGHAPFPKKPKPKNGGSSHHTTHHKHPSSGGGSGGSGAGETGGSPSQNHALAHRMYPHADWASWDYVENREAGWNRFARNPSSGAYGIPQALPPSKMPHAAQASGGSHAGPQIKWMWDYMKARYGGPKGAAEHERTHNWYASGGKVKHPGPGKTPDDARWNAAIDALKLSHAPLADAEKALGSDVSSTDQFDKISSAARKVQGTLKAHAILHENAPEVVKHEGEALQRLISRVGLAEGAYSHLATHGQTPGTIGGSGPPPVDVPPPNLGNLLPGGLGPDYIPGGGSAPQQFAVGGGVGDIASMFSMGGGVSPASFSAPSGNLAAMPMYGGGPVPTRQLGAAAQSVGASSAPFIGNMTIHNPVAEKAGESITRATQRAALLAGRGVA